MGIVSFLLLFASIALSTGRNLLSKNISDEPFGTKKFFGLQTIIFFSGSVLLLILSISSPFKISLPTLLFAFIYGALLVSAQWNYTGALKNGKTGICSTVYSLGFVIPTIFGSLKWSEPLSVMDIFGILAVIPAIILTGTKNNDSSVKSNRFFLPLILAMICSGGLGIMQKVQQKSAYADEKTWFILLSFLFASLFSLIGFLAAKDNEQKIKDKKPVFAIGIGVAFASCNLLNTILAGRLASAVFFPILNIGTILFSTILGILFFKEHPTKKDLFIFLLGIVSILLITLN